MNRNPQILNLKHFNPNPEPSTVQPTPNPTGVGVLNPTFECRCVGRQVGGLVFGGWGAGREICGLWLGVWFQDLGVDASFLVFWCVALVTNWDLREVVGTYESLWNGHPGVSGARVGASNSST